MTGNDKGRTMDNTGPSFARDALIAQAEKTAEAIEGSKGTARCEAHPHMESGVVVTLRCLVAIMKAQGSDVTDRRVMWVKVRAAVISWIVTGAIGAGLVVLLASFMVGWQWQPILEKILP